MTRTFPRLLALAAAPLLIAGAPASAEEAACPVSISFASYGAGIDARALAGVEAMLKRDRRVVSLDRRHWGREGEVDLCAKVRRKADANRIARRIAAKLPRKPRGPIRIETNMGLRFEAPATPIELTSR